LSQIALVWGSMLALPWLLQKRRNININAVTKLMPMPMQRILEYVSLSVMAVLSIVAVVYGFEIFWDSFVRGRTTGSLMNLPVWISELAVPFGFLLMFFASLAEILRLLKGAPLVQDAHELV